MECLANRPQFVCRTLLIAERIDVRLLAKVQRSEWQRVATPPLTLLTDAGGVVVLFRYGSVVFFDVAASEEAELLERLGPFISGLFPRPEVEEIVVRIDSQATEGVENGVVVVRNHEVERLQVIAENTGKSIILGLYESRVADSFDRIEPLALDVEITGRSRRKGRELLRHLGTALLSQQQMVGRVQASEKPDLLWDRPDLESLNLRVADEFELRDRNIVLERKLDLIARTSQVLLDLLQDRRTLRVEWYVVGLIVFEIFLTIFQMSVGRR